MREGRNQESMWKYFCPLEINFDSNFQQNWWYMYTDEFVFTSRIKAMTNVTIIKNISWDAEKNL